MQYGWVCAQEPGRSYGRQEPGHQVHADSWGKEQGQGLCVDRWGWQSRTVEPALGAPCPQRWHGAGGLQMEKAAGRGVLEGGSRAGETEGQWLPAQGRAVRVSHCRAEAGRFTSWALKKQMNLPNAATAPPSGTNGPALPTSSLEPGRPRLPQSDPQPFPWQAQCPSPFTGWIQGLCPHPQLTLPQAAAVQRWRRTPISAPGFEHGKISQESPTLERPG